MKIKNKPSDFIVEEILADRICKIEYGIKEKINDFFKYLLDRFNLIKPKDFLHLTLVKTNLTTLDALKIISSKLNISLKRINFAGNKDKRAITSQRISLYKVRIRDIAKIKHKNFFLKEFSYANEPITLGKLEGNKFRINLIPEENESLILNKSKILNKLKKLQANPILPNYFDEQRFGKAKNNHLIGKFILNNDFENAVKFILFSYGEKEDNEIKEFKEFIKENWGNWELIKNQVKKYKRLRKKLLNEILIINYLAKNPKDWVNALRRLKKKILRIYIHAYQAYLFNLILRNCLRLKLKPEVLPLIGYETNLDQFKPEIKKIINEILEKENISCENFKIKSMPELSEKGALRNSFFKINDFCFKLEDEKINLSFWLEKGAYATLVVKFLNLKLNG